MRCPFCGEDHDKVIDSRSTDRGRVVRRRRQCQACRKRFTTYETIEAGAPLTVTKNDGRREPFDRNKIMAGLQKACFKRPVSAEAMQQIVDAVEEETFRKHDREVAALEIGKAVAERLKHVDQVAYVRFASVYKQFRDLDDFLDEVRDVLESTPPTSPEQPNLFDS